jgi:hypothetical protein
MHWPAHKKSCLEKREKLGVDIGPSGGMTPGSKKGGFGNFGGGTLEEFWGENPSSDRIGREGGGTEADRYRKRIKSFGGLMYDENGHIVHKTKPPTGGNELQENLSNI